MAGKSKATKKDLEAKIADLEAKLTKLSAQIDATPAEKPAPKPAEVAKPKATLPKGTAKAETPKPAPKPAEVAKPKATLPKGTAKAETPKPAETISQHPVTIQEALENAYMTAPMTDFHQYRAKVTGYSPAPNRYFVRMTAPVGKVPTTNWNDQKVKVTGYTAASNQYFATRARRAYHPAEKRFGTFSGVNMSVDGVEIKPQTQQAPPPEPTQGKLPKDTLPKSSSQTQQASPPQTASNGKSKQEQLADYEADYLKRIEEQKIADEKEYQELLEAEVKSRATQTRGTLPKGF